MEPITPQTRMHAAPDVVFSRVGDEAVLLNVKSGVYYALDPIGTRVWTWGIDGRPLGEIQALLEQEFAVELDVLWTDLLVLATDLRQNGLVTTAQADSVAGSVVLGIQE